MTRLLLISLITAWIVVNQSLAAASAPDAATSFLRQLEAVIEDPIPPLSEVLPGYSAGAASTTGVVVADFGVRDGTQRYWGMLIGQVLRWELLHAGNPALRVPDFNTYYQDATGPEIPQSDIGRSVASANLVAKRLGLSHLLTGTVTVADEQFDLEISLRKAESGDLVETYRLTGPINQLPQNLNTVLQRTATALGTPKAAGDGVPFSGQTLTKIADAFTDDRVERKARMRKLWLDGLATPLIAAHYLWHLDVGNDLDDYFKRIEQVREMFPGEPGIEFIVARYIGYRDRPRLYDTKVARLKKIAANRPHDPTPMLVLCDTLGENGYTLEAIAIGRELVRRYPENYRAWWSMGASLLNHAWQLRGTNFWKDVPPKGQRQFPILKDHGNRSMDKALALNEYNSRLWSAKMWAIGDYNAAFMEAFETATRLDPKNRHAYEMAINYALPQWGGSFDAQDDVLALARKNIDDDQWQDYIQRTYIGKRPFWHAVRRTIMSAASALLQPLNAIVTAFLLIAVGALAIFLRARNEPARKRQ